MRSDHPVKTYYGMTYNPYGERKPNKHSFVIKYLDAKHHVLMGEPFWDYLGGSGTYTDLLSVHRKVGKDKSKDLIGKAVNIP